MPDPIKPKLYVESTFFKDLSVCDIFILVAPISILIVEKEREKEGLVFLLVAYRETSFGQAFV